MFYGMFRGSTSSGGTDAEIPRGVGGIALLPETYVEGGHTIAQPFLGTYHTTVTHSLSAANTGNGCGRGYAYTLVVAGNHRCYIVDAAAAAVIDVEADVCRFFGLEHTVTIAVGEDNVTNFKIVGRIGRRSVVVIATAPVTDAVVETAIGIAISITVTIVPVTIWIVVALAFLLHLGTCHSGCRTGNATDKGSYIGTMVTAHDITDNGSEHGAHIGTGDTTIPLATGGAAAEAKEQSEEQNKVFSHDAFMV